jgi:hypothetical protein
MSVLPFTVEVREGERREVRGRLEVSFRHWLTP